jgi:membrane associated rhomboid family serine protease
MVVVPVLIAINVLVYALWWVNGSSSHFMIDNFLVSYDLIKDGHWWVLITAVFSHNMFLHILVNMIVLKDFGGFLERLVGPVQFLTFYLIAGVISSAVHAVVSAKLIGDPSLHALGASGAIAGVVLVFALVFPKQKILFFGLIPIPAIFGALLFIGLDLWGLTAQIGGGGLPIGHGAHLGGAATGIVWYFLFLRNRKLRFREVE